MRSSVFLPFSLPGDDATLQALCRTLPAHHDLASLFRHTSVLPARGSWSDAERNALNGGATDLPDARRLLPDAAPVTIPEGTKTIAIASPMSAVLGLTDLTPLDCDQLQLTADDARSLCSACDAHLSPEGVRFSFVDAQHWLVCIDTAVSVLTERPQWMTGEPLRPNLPRGSDARRVERWMNELQMLLYTHPVNVAREDRGLPPINVIWLWAFSALAEVTPVVRSAPSTDSGVNAALTPNSVRGDLSTGSRVNAELTPNSVRGELVEPRNGVTTIDDFARAFRAGDLAAWQQAWSTHAGLLMSASQIVLGDSRPRLQLTPHSPGWLQSLHARFTRPPTLATTLADLRRQALTQTETLA